MESERIGINEASWPGVVKYGVPGGFCAGVERSVDAYRDFVNKHQGNAVYSVGKPAHNSHVNQEFVDMGVNFVEDIDQVPQDAHVIFGPHGHTDEDESKASLESFKQSELLNSQSVGRSFIFTECPLVTKVKKEIKDYAREGYTIIYYGQLDKNGYPHPETRAAMSSGDVILVTSVGQALSEETQKLIVDFKKVAFASQTTHNADETIEMAKLLKLKYPNLKTPKTEDICFATRNRQQVVREIDAQAIVVIGDSRTSSNTRSLIEAAKQRGKEVRAVNDASELIEADFIGIDSVGIEASASAPKEIIDQVLEFFSSRGSIIEEFRIKDERGKIVDESRTHFELPRVHSSFIPQSVRTDPNRF